MVFGLLVTAVMGQRSLESAYRTTGKEVVAVFEAQREALQSCSAVLLQGRDEIGYGVVISADGYLLTKASLVLEVDGLAVTVGRERFKEVEVVAVDSAWDVALLKVAAEGLKPVEYAETSAVAQGTWVAANGATSRTRRRLLPGIISANSREIPPAGGAALGVVLKVEGGRLAIEEVAEHSGAADAGLKKGDVIVKVGGTAVAGVEEIAEALKESKAGDVVRVEYLRGEREFAVDVRVSTRGEMFQIEMDRNDMMSGDFSKRRSGFPRVIQHDILASAQTMGGPLLDLDGKCLGMNIARANRTENYAIPLEELQEIAAGLMKQVAKPAVESGE